MRRRTLNRYVTILEERPELFDERVNEIIGANSVTSYSITHELNRKAFCCHIEYTVEIVEFANIKEELEAQGERYYCDDCPYFEEPRDRRCKLGTCKCGTTTASRSACLMFYQELAKGEIEPKGGRL